MQAEAASEEAAEAEAKLQEAKAKFKAELSAPAAAKPAAFEPIEEVSAAVEQAVFDEPAEGVPVEEPAVASAEPKEISEVAGVTETSTAAEICAAYFKAIDIDDNGFIEETEMLQISEIAFGAPPPPC